MMGKFKNIDSTLRNEIILTNNSFTQAQLNYKYQVVVDNIKSRFSMKKKQLDKNRTNLESILQLELLNFAQYLFCEDKYRTFTDWIILNQACLEEGLLLERAPLGLRGIVAN